jgi:hypothetical protein
MAIKLPSSGASFFAYHWIGPPVSIPELEIIQQGYFEFIISSTFSTSFLSYVSLLECSMSP